MINILPYSGSHLEHVLRITQSAWSTVFPLLREDIPAYVYEAFYPEGWVKRQLQDVQAVCNDVDTDVFVAELDGAVAGFVGLREHTEDSMGEVYVIAVDPAYQRRGLSHALLEFSFEWMRERGLKMALVETGADRGHEPARANYESIGFERYPVARYFKKL